MPTVSLSVLGRAEATFCVLHTYELVLSGALGVNVCERGEWSEREDRAVTGRVNGDGQSHESGNDWIELGVVEELAHEDDLVRADSAWVGGLHRQGSCGRVKSETAVVDEHVIFSRPTIHLS